MLHQLFVSEKYNAVVFQGRHMAYGAYQLRKHYHKRLYMGMLFPLFIFAAIGSYILFTGKEENHNLLHGIKGTLVLGDFSKVIFPKPTSTIKPAASTHGASDSYKIKNDNEVDPNKNNTAVTGNSGDGLSDSIASGPPSPPLPPGPPMPPPTPPAPPIPPVITIAEIMPSYQGGDEAMLRFISKQLIYTDAARKNEAEGLIVLSFIVQPDGSLSDIETLRSIGYGMDEQAMKVVKKMPNWIPGSQQGHKVAVKMTLPIRCSLE